jgi:DNA-binding MarR family transcriptional regulator
MSENDEQTLTELIELTRELARAYHRLRVFGDRTRVFYDYGSTTAEILSMLYDFGEHSISEIARKRSVSRQFVVKLARQLEAQGAVSVSEHVAGKRGYVIDLTEEGKSDWEQRRQQFALAMSGMEQAFTTDELKSASSVLRRFAT